MAGTSSRTNKKTSESRGENGKSHKSLTEGINEKVNAAEEKVQEIEEKNKPKRGKIAELTKQLEEAVKRAEEAEKRAKEADKKTESTNKDNPISFYIGRRRIPVEEAQKEIDRLISEIETMKDTITNNEIVFNDLQQDNKIFGEGTDALVNRNRELNRERDDLQEQKDILQKILDRKNGKIFTEEPKSANSENFEETKIDTSEPKAEEVKTDNSDGGLSSSRDVDAELREIFKAVKEGRIDDAQKLADEAAKKYDGTSEPKATSSENAEEIKSANSENFEETVTPEAGEAKVEGEPKANTEQTQTTQEPKSEAKQTSTESSEMTPEEAYEYLSDKKNFKEANTYFSSGKDSYIGTNGKHLPKSWFDVYNGNKESDHSIQPFLFNSNNKDVFTASLREKGLLEDPKKEPSREDTVKTLAEAGAKAKFDDWINSKGNKFRGIFGKHKVLYSTLLLAGISPAILKAIEAIGDWGREQAIEDMQVPDKEFWGESEDNNDDYNGEPIEPGNVAEQVANAAQETGQADNTAEEQAAQALQENLPQGEADTTNQSKGESPVATNASTPASTKANNAPASTAKPAPTQDITQGLPPVVVNNTPPVNPNSSGMTYSQMIEAGQAPQAGSMAYNANNPDMVTAGLIDAMNQNPQAGSDAIGYGDLYDQNFIDYWAKRNPNLAFGVSQGRR